jgi:hypothetical protein
LKYATPFLAPVIDGTEYGCFTYRSPIWKPCASAWNEVAAIANEIVQRKIL